MVPEEHSKLFFRFLYNNGKNLHDSACTNKKSCRCVGFYAPYNKNIFSRSGGLAGVLSRHADGRGLYLVVREGGSKAWVLRTQIEGARRDLGLGSVATLSFAAARGKVADMRARLKAGEEIRPKAAPKSKPKPTFAEAADACHEALKSGWANRRHRDSWLASLENHMFPAIGTVPIDTVTSIAIRDAIAPIWLTIPETARRVLQRVGVVLDYGHIREWRPNEASLRSVRKGLPRQPAEENHFAALPYAEVPAFAARLMRLRWLRGAMRSCSRS